MSEALFEQRAGAIADRVFAGKQVLPQELDVQDTYWQYIQILNGGFVQWIGNSGRERCLITLHSLARISLPNVARLTKVALEFVDIERFESDDDAVQFLRNMPAEKYDQLRCLDGEYDKFPDDIYGNVLAYLVDLDAQLANPELPALRGTWELVACRKGGVETRPSCIYDFESITMTVQPEGRAHSFYTLRLDSAARPKQMDIVAHWPSGEASAAETLYELDGDILKWCSDDAGKRPAAFLADGSTTGTLNVLRRLKGRT